MKLKKIFSVMAIVSVLALSMVSMASAANGWWVGPYGGLSLGTSQDIQVNSPFINNATIYNAKIRTGFTTGLSGGFDFTDPKMFPDWAKYFGVQVDLGYTQSNFSAQTRNVNNIANVGFANVDGGRTNLSFMLVGRLPLMVTPDYPNGRFSPYVGVGPTVQFASYDFTNYGGGSNTSTNVGLVSEAGIRYMVTQNFSAGVAYRYNYLPGSTNVSLPGVGNVNLAGTQNAHQGIVRLAYHF
jgi:opacity protein-like surface antigen